MSWLSSPGYNDVPWNFWVEKTATIEALETTNLSAEEIMREEFSNRLSTILNGYHKVWDALPQVQARLYTTWPSSYTPQPWVEDVLFSLYYQELRNDPNTAERIQKYESQRLKIEWTNYDNTPDTQKQNDLITLKSFEGQLTNRTKATLSAWEKKFRSLLSHLINKNIDSKSFLKWRSDILDPTSPWWKLEWEFSLTKLLELQKKIVWNWKDTKGKSPSLKQFKQINKLLKLATRTDLNQFWSIQFGDTDPQEVIRFILWRKSIAADEWRIGTPLLQDILRSQIDLDRFLESKKLWKQELTIEDYQHIIKKCIPFDAVDSLYTNRDSNVPVRTQLTRLTWKEDKAEMKWLEVLVQQYNDNPSQTRYSLGWQYAWETQTRNETIVKSSEWNFFQEFNTFRSIWNPKLPISSWNRLIQKYTETKLTVFFPWMSKFVEQQRIRWESDTTIYNQLLWFTTDAITKKIWPSYVWRVLEACPTLTAAEIIELTNAGFDIHVLKDFFSMFPNLSPKEVYDYFDKAKSHLDSNNLKQAYVDEYSLTDKWLTTEHVTPFMVLKVTLRRAEKYYPTQFTFEDGLSLLAWTQAITSSTVLNKILEWISSEDIKIVSLSRSSNIDLFNLITFALSWTPSSQDNSRLLEIRDEITPEVVYWRREEVHSWKPESIKKSYRVALLLSSQYSYDTIPRWVDKKEFIQDIATVLIDNWHLQSNWIMKDILKREDFWEAVEMTWWEFESSLPLSELLWASLACERNLINRKRHTTYRETFQKPFASNEETIRHPTSNTYDPNRPVEWTFAFTPYSTFFNALGWVNSAWNLNDTDDIKEISRKFGHIYEQIIALQDFGNTTTLSESEVIFQTFENREDLYNRPLLKKWTQLSFINAEREWFSQNLYNTSSFSDEEIRKTWAVLKTKSWVLQWNWLNDYNAFSYEWSQLYWQWNTTFISSHGSDKWEIMVDDYFKIKPDYFSKVLKQWAKYSRESRWWIIESIQCSWYNLAQAYFNNWNTDWSPIIRPPMSILTYSWSDKEPVLKFSVNSRTRFFNRMIQEIEEGSRTEISVGEYIQDVWPWASTTITPWIFWSNWWSNNFTAFHVTSDYAWEVYTRNEEIRKKLIKLKNDILTAKEENNNNNTNDWESTLYNVYKRRRPLDKYFDQVLLHIDWLLEKKEYAPYIVVEAF